MFPSWSNITHNATDKKLIVSHFVPHIQNLIMFMSLHTFCIARQ